MGSIFRKQPNRRQWRAARENGALCFPEIWFEALEVSASAGKTCPKRCCLWWSQAAQNPVGSVARGCLSAAPSPHWGRQVWWQRSFFFPCLSHLPKGLKAPGSPASAGPQPLGWMGAATFIHCPGLEEEKTSQVSKEVSEAWLGAGLLAANPSLAVGVYITLWINSLPFSSLSLLPSPLLKCLDRGGFLVDL